MGRVILITGGAATGKSRWAISYFASCDNVLYMCTGKNIDAETANRIKFSNEHNGVEWVLAENVTDPSAMAQTANKFYILDNLASYASNVITEMCPSPELMTKELKKTIEKKVTENIISLMDKINELDATLIIVTIEAGFSVCPSNPEQVAFREIIGAINQHIANTSADVYLSASGIQFKIK